MFDYDYSNVMTTITSTTSNLIDDPDRVTPKVECVAYDSTKDVIKLINTNATPAYMCDYYIVNAASGAGDLNVINLPGLLAHGGGALATPAYECLRCPIGK